MRIAEQYETMRLIEEFMIQANVCAAETLEKAGSPLVYRVHDAPSKEKIGALAEFLASLDIKIAKGQVLKPAQFNQILDRVRETEYERMVSDVVLRSQAQAIYSPENLGHFGLNLRRYAHFTSPIRRYADLIVHRALIGALKLGPEGLTKSEIAELDDIAEHISMCERRAMLAERDSVDRYIASYLSDRVGAEFTGRISGATRFGLFIRLDETGADGLVPISSLGHDFFHHNEALHALIGAASGHTYRIGDRVRVVLREAVPITGGLRFDLIEGGSPGEPARGKSRSPRRPPDRKKRGGKKNAGAKQVDKKKGIGKSTKRR